MSATSLAQSRHSSALAIAPDFSAAREEPGGRLRALPDGQWMKWSNCGAGFAKRAVDRRLAIGVAARRGNSTRPSAPFPGSFAPRQTTRACFGNRRVYLARAERSPEGDDDGSARA